MNYAVIQICIMIFECYKIFVISSLFLIINANKHDIIIERAVKDYVDTKYADFNVSVTKINRNEQGLSGFLNVYKNIYARTYITLQLYALFSNEYRLMPASISKSVCELMKTEWQWVADEIRKDSNIPKYCPVPVGFYYVKNYVIDSKNLPEMPWDKIMLYLNFTLRQKNEIKNIAGVKLYFRYDRDAMFLRRHRLQ